MKKMTILLLALVLVLCAVGCGAPKEQAPSPPTSLSPAVTINVPGVNEELGITLTLKDMTRSGATVVCAQSGGESVKELFTGSYSIVERLTDGVWVEVEQVEFEGELAWTAEAWLVNLNGTTEWSVKWEWLYGQLPDGHYRIGKEFSNSVAPGKSEKAMIYTEFFLGYSYVEVEQ